VKISGSDKIFMQKFLAGFFLLISIVFFNLVFVANNVSAVTGAKNIVQGNLDKTAKGAYGAYKDGESGREEILYNVGFYIQTVLGFIGVLFLILTIYAGFLYMTAEGDDTKAKKGLDMIKGAIIGLIIVSSAYAISSFVFGKLEKAGEARDEAGAIIQSTR
jgi:hypothetical protein